MLEALEVVGDGHDAHDGALVEVSLRKYIFNLNLGCTTASARHAQLHKYNNLMLYIEFGTVGDLFCCHPLCHELSVKPFMFYSSHVEVLENAFLMIKGNLLAILTYGVTIYNFIIYE